MIHVKPLPGKPTARPRTPPTLEFTRAPFFFFFYFLGTPLYDGNGVKRIINAACDEAEIYLKCGIVSKLRRKKKKVCSTYIGVRLYLGIRVF